MNFMKISLETANQFYAWGWRASIAGALITFFGVGFLYWGTRVRDHDFETQVANLNLEAGQARERAGKLEERAKGLEKEAEQARLETERLKKELGWRELTNDKQEKILSALAGSSMQITLGWTAGDPESSYFARQFAELFIKAGSEIKTFAPFGMLGEQKYGLEISGSEENEITILAGALQSAGFDVVVKINQRKPDGSKYFTHLFVGYRAPPALRQ